MRLKDKVAIITGGAAGIGRATAEVFAREGARLAIWDINSAQGNALVDKLRASTVAKFYEVNVADYAQVQAAVVRVIADLGRIDILINNAGITADATLLKMTEAQWDKVISVNLKGVFNCTQAVAQRMVEAGRGKIINAASVVALYGNFGQTNYVATKAGVIGMTKTWARELGRKGICVNAVAPGFIATEMIQSVPQKVLDMIREKTPLGRLGQPEDIANAYLFLASEEANFINGAVLSVDGGLVM